MNKLTRRAEMKISKSFPPVFALVIYVWSVDYIHFLGEFSTFTNVIKAGYGLVFLSFSPLEDEFPLNSEEHIMLTHYVTRIFVKSVNKVVFLIGYNWVTNK